MRRLLLIGSRDTAVDPLLAACDLQVSAIWAFAGSRLERRGRELSTAMRVFSRGDWPVVRRELAEASYDVLLSVGCPFLLPISSLPKGRLYLNLHPAALPSLRGLHPVNGALLNEMSDTGVTLHEMTDGCDDGPIVAQERVPITADIDLGLLYMILFDLEPVVLEKGFDVLRENDWRECGVPQVGIVSSYRRNGDDMLVDPKRMTTREVLRRIRAFGIASQGCRCLVGEETLLAFSADEIVNSYVKDRYSSASPGSLLATYEGKLLLKTVDGIIRLREWKRGGC
jgi:methionyl-tRNA formyltransferase